MLPIFAEIRHLLVIHLWVERLESGLAHAYDVIEIRVLNKKNFQFGVVGL